MQEKINLQNISHKNLITNQMPEIKTRTIDKLIQNSFQNLRTHFRTIGSKSGWHQYLGNSKIGNVATSQALILFDLFNENINTKHLALSTLLESQSLNTGDKSIDGGWTYVTNFADLPTTEPTCWALLALHKEYRNNDCVKAGIEWLFNNHIPGTNDQGWGTLGSDISRVYSTCLALKTLKLYNHEQSPAFERGLNWLLSAQNTDYGWGDRFGMHSSITHTSHSIIALLDAGHNPESNYIKKAVNWLINSLDNKNSPLTNGGYQEEIEFDYKKNNKVNHHRILYNHLPEPYAVTALIKSGNIQHKIVFNLINQFITNNNDAYWNHPHITNTNRKPLWAIYDTMIMFNSLIRATTNWVNTDIINLKNNTISSITNTHPFSINKFVSKFILGIWGKILLIIIIAITITYFTDLFPNISNKTYMQMVIYPLIIELLGYYITEKK